MSDCRVLTAIPSSSNSLTIGADGQLYYTTGFLNRTDPVTGKIEVVGPLTYYASGDITFYNGDLYMSGYGSALFGTDGGGIIKINIPNTLSSYVYIPGGGGSLYGLVSVASSLHKNTVYALANVNDHLSNVVELDMENRTFKRIIGTLPFSVLDAASEVENGGVNGIVINKINNRQDCDAPTKGIVEVVTAPSLNPLTYKLSNASATFTNTTGIFTGVAAGAYQLTVTSAVDEQTAPVIVPAYSLVKPRYTSTVKNQVCDQGGEITFKTPDGDSKYLVRSGTDVFPINHTFTGLVAGTPYHYDILNEYGCKVDEADINVPKDKCTIKFNKVDVQQQCDAIHQGMVQVITNAHTDQYSYTLNGVTNSTGAFSNLFKGSYTIKITSPEDEISVPVIIPDYKLTEPVLSYDATNPACAVKGDIKFNIAGNSSAYSIQYGSIVYPLNHVFDGLSEGDYQFTLLSSAGCLIDNYTVTLKYQPCPIVISKIEFAAECNAFGKASVKVTTPPIPETYSFTLNGVTNNTGVFDMLDPGTYDLLVSASGGGTPQTRNIIVPDFRLNRPVTVIRKVNPICELPGQISMAVGNDPSKYDLLYNGLIHPSNYVFNNLAEGDHQFTVLKKDGCIADIINVNLVLEVCSPVSFPNAFTPNQDGMHDVFRADPKSKATNFRLQIFNRWGQMVFTSTDLQQGWDGQFRGAACAVGTYYWIATFTNQEHQPAMLKGYVSLIR